MIDVHHSGLFADITSHIHSAWLGFGIGEIVECDQQMFATVGIFETTRAFGFPLVFIELPGVWFRSVSDPFAQLIDFISEI